jgi:hypothetical protein
VVVTKSVETLKGGHLGHVFRGHRTVETEADGLTEEIAKRGKGEQHDEQVVHEVVSLVTSSQKE